MCLLIASLSYLLVIDNNNSNYIIQNYVAVE